MLKYIKKYLKKGNSMANQNSILSQDPNFYSSYEYEEQDGSSTAQAFISILFKLVLLLSILFTIYFAFNYVSNMDINFKKFDFLNLAKQSKPPIPQINMEVTPKENKINFKKAELDVVVNKVIEKIDKEKVVKTSKTSTDSLIKPREVTSHKELKSPYLTKEYLDAVKKALGKN